MSDVSTRIEHDLLGDREVPRSAYYGIHTLRAVENFAITGTTLATCPDLIRALAAIKQAAALANRELGLLDPERCDAIVAACIEIRGGALHDQFVVDQIQGGAGTSTNMNANEVIANRALELLGAERGDYVRPAPPQRARQHGPEHQRRVSDGAQDRRDRGDPPPCRRHGGPAHQLRGETRGIPRRPQDGPHPAAGCGADDARPGIRHLCPDAGRGRGAPGRGRTADPRDQSRRDRDRHRHHRPPALRGTGARAALHHHGNPADHGGRPGRSHPGLRRLRAGVGGAQARRRQAVEDLQRPAPALERGPGPDSARSTCRRARPAPRSCPARSTR